MRPTSRLTPAEAATLRRSLTKLLDPSVDTRLSKLEKLLEAGLLGGGPSPGGAASRRSRRRSVTTSAAVPEPARVAFLAGQPDDATLLDASGVRGERPRSECVRRDDRLHRVGELSDRRAVVDVEPGQPVPELVGHPSAPRSSMPARSANSRATIGLGTPLSSSMTDSRNECRRGTRVASR